MKIKDNSHQDLCHSRCMDSMLTLYKIKVATLALRPLLTRVLLPAAAAICHRTIQTSECNNSDSLTQSHCQVAWGDFCVDPWGSSDAVHDAGCLMRSKSYMYFHMMDQYHCMVTSEGQWAVDYIGRVESANEDWKDVSGGEACSSRRV